MNSAVPDANIDTVWPPGVPVLPDPDDRHVIAAGMRAGASRIVTWNLRHFPDDVLMTVGLRAETPDGLLTGLFGDVANALISTVRRAGLNLRRTTPTPLEFVDAIERQGLSRFASALRGMAEQL